MLELVVDLCVYVFHYLKECVQTLKKFFINCIVLLIHFQFDFKIKIGHTFKNVFICVLQDLQIQFKKNINFTFPFYCIKLPLQGK